MMDYTFPCKAYGALSEHTWKKMNEALSGWVCKKRRKDNRGEAEAGHNGIRDEHTSSADSWLLWDSYRTLARLMKEAGEDMRRAGLKHRFHTRKVRKLEIV